VLRVVNQLYEKDTDKAVTQLEQNSGFAKDQTNATYNAQVENKEMDHPIF
jgi:hypothetical protein